MDAEMEGLLSFDVVRFLVREGDRDPWVPILVIVVEVGKCGSRNDGGERRIGRLMMTLAQGGGQPRVLVPSLATKLLYGREPCQTFLCSRGLLRFSLGHPMWCCIQYLTVATFRVLITSVSSRIYVFRLQSLHDLREVIHDPQVKRGGFELDLVSHQFSPFVPSGVDPPHEIEMVYVFECAEVCALLNFVRRNRVRSEGEQLPNEQT